jgi:hypothetical protein
MLGKRMDNSSGRKGTIPDRKDARVSLHRKLHLPNPYNHDDTDPTPEAKMDLSSEEHTTHCLDVAGGGAMDEFSVLAPEYSAKGCISLSSMDGGNTEIGGHSEQSLIEQRHAVDPMSDNWPVYHPCYFHLRMYGEADYFMINELKSKAEARFCAALGDFPDKESFAEVVKELYSSRAKYCELKKLAINVIVDKLPDLQKGFTPAWFQTLGISS